MYRKDSPQSVIDSYRRRQQMAPYFLAGLAILLVVVGIIILVVWLTGNGDRVSPASLFASATPTSTDTPTMTPTVPTSTPTVTPTATDTPEPTATATVSGPVEYVVQEGDNCWDIAVANEVDFNAFMAINNFGATCPIAAGDKILLPARDAEMPTPEPVCKPDMTGKVNYTVQLGDTLAIIASQCNSTIDAITRENRLTSDAIQYGQQLVIPVNIVTPTPTRAPSATPTQGAAGAATAAPTATP